MMTIDQVTPADVDETATLIAEIKAYYGSAETPGVDDIHARCSAIARLPPSCWLARMARP